MAINGVNGARAPIYPVPAGVARASVAPERRPASPSQAEGGAGAARDIAAAIRNDAADRAALINSPKAPDGVDQELWSVLTRDERAHFIKAGAMGPLTYGRTPSVQERPSAPIMRGGRLDIRA